MYDFFISHSSKNKEIARLIYYTAHANSLNPWYDESQLEIGDSITPSLINGINNSKAYLLFHSQYVYTSSFIQTEMDSAKEKYLKNPEFKIIVVKIDKEEIRETFWKQFLYLSWNKNEQHFSLLRLIEDLTGKKGLLELTATSLLNRYPSDITPSVENSISDLTRNYLFLQLSQLKYFLESSAYSGHESELKDTIQKLLEVSTFCNLPRIMPGIFQIGNGVWESLHATRMRIPPRIIIEGLPEDYNFELIINNEVYTHFRFLKNGTVINFAIPFVFSINFDSEL